MRVTRNLEANLINLEDNIGDATQSTPVNADISGTFNPIKVIETLPPSVPGCILSTRKDKEIAAEMWLKAFLDLAWEGMSQIRGAD